MLPECVSYPFIRQVSNLALGWKLINHMNKLLILLSLGFLLSCEGEDQPNDVAARASGRYAVQSYVLNGDTLYTSKGVNKVGVSEFYIVVDRKNPDTVQVRSVYRDKLGSVNHIKDVSVSEMNGTFRLSASTAVPQFYESRIEGNAFYERAARGGPGVFILPLSYSLKPPVDPALEGTIIVAERQ